MKQILLSIILCSSCMFATYSENTPLIPTSFGDIDNESGSLEQQLLISQLNEKSATMGRLVNRTALMGLLLMSSVDLIANGPFTHGSVPLFTAIFTSTGLMLDGTISCFHRFGHQGK